MPTPSLLPPVLAEIFGLNGWVSALAMPLFARTAPELELGQHPDSTREGRRHKEATSTEDILADAQVSIDWLRQSPGHAALVSATLVELTPA